MQPVYVPGDVPANPFGQLLTGSDPVAFYASYPYNVAPVNDDRPFFFYTVQPRDMSRFFREREQAQRGLQGQSRGAAAVRRAGGEPGRDRC